MASNQFKNPQNVAGGLKATIHNPRISDQTKESAKERLDRMGADAETSAQSPAGRVDTLEVNDAQFEDEEEGAPLSEGPGTRTRAKTTGVAGRPSQYGEAITGEEYENAEYDNEGEPQGHSRGAISGQPGEKRVLGGYKATLKNPRVSEEAKEHAKAVLEEHDAL